MLHQPMRRRRRLILLNHVPPEVFLRWGALAPYVDAYANFKTGFYWTKQSGVLPLTSFVSTTRASTKYGTTVAGVLTPFTSNNLAVTDNGALIEEARTNKSTNYNANPTDLTNVTKSGDVAATLTVVDDTVALLAAGLQNSASSGKVYKLDNSAGVANAAATPSGNTGNTNLHALSIYMRGSGNVKFQTTSVGGTTFVLTSTYQRFSNVLTPSASTNASQVLALPGTVVYFILNQLEEGAFVTSPIVIAGSAATRAADIPQLIGPAQTAALAAKSAFFQTSGVGGGIPRFLDLITGNFTFNSTTTVIAQTGAGNATGTLGSGTYTGTVKAAFGFDSSSYTAKANGGATGTNANPWAFSSPAILGNRAAGDRALNGYMQEFALSSVKGLFDNSTA